MPYLGIIGFGAAIANYRKRKAEYDALLEQRDGLLAAVQMFNQNKNNPYINSIQVNSVDFAQGLNVTTILRVGNMVGKVFRTQASVIFTNTSSQTYFIGDVSADIFIGGVKVYVYKTAELLQSTATNIKHATPQTVYLGKEIKSGQTLEVKLPYGISAMPDMDAFRKMICEAAGKKLITSCPKISIENGVTADILFTWSIPNDETKTCKMANRQGVLRYMGEAFYK